MSDSRHQDLRVLGGLYALSRVTDDGDLGPAEDVLALVRGPDGTTVMRRDETASDAWVPLWNGDDAHDPDATGMLHAVVAPLAAASIPVWVAASYDGDLVLVPSDLLDEAVAVLDRAGHHVTR